MSTCLLASATPVVPTLLKSPRPPKVIVPRVRVETNRPECPSLRYSMGSSLSGRAFDGRASPTRCGRRCEIAAPGAVPDLYWTFLALAAHLHLPAHCTRYNGISGCSYTPFWLLRFACIACNLRCQYRHSQ